MIYCWCDFIAFHLQYHAWMVMQYYYYFIFHFQHSMWFHTYNGEYCATMALLFVVGICVAFMMLRECWVIFLFSLAIIILKDRFSVESCIAYLKTEIEIPFRWSKWCRTVIKNEQTKNCNRCYSKRTKTQWNQSSNSSCAQSKPTAIIFLW